MKVIIDKLAIEYEDTGTGPVILALHGWGDSLKTFDHIASELSEKYRFVRLDLPGFGGSELPPVTWDLQNYVDLVGAFINKLDLKVDLLIGHSLGGRVAIKGLSVGTFRPHRVVLIASAGILKSRSARNRAFKAAAKAGKLVTMIPPLSLWRRQLRTRLYYASGSDYLNAGPLAKTFIKIISEDLLPPARTIKQPVLLIWGSNDTDTPVADGQQLASAISGAKFEIIPGAGHFVHQEQTERVAALIEDFDR
jgi:pimeloyl-ACP methyl ester carboxylesterase